MMRKCTCGTEEQIQAYNQEAHGEFHRTDSRLICRSHFPDTDCSRCKCIPVSPRLEPEQRLSLSSKASHRLRDRRIRFQLLDAPNRCAADGSSYAAFRYAGRRLAMFCY